MPPVADENSSAPQVSIGLPTYNRGDRLARAIDSALDQTHRDLELVISDNGSTDGTRELCHAYARRDARIRYIRQPTNRGPIANFNAVIDALRGDFAVLLADDDWLDHDYVERCLAELEAHPDHALVGGLARYIDESGQSVRDGLDVVLLEDDPSTRVRRYLREVDDNGIFYGTCRRETLQQAAPMRNVLGADWLLMAGVVFTGKAITIRETRVNRSIGGTSRTVGQIMRSMNEIGWLEARVPFVYTAFAAFCNVARWSDLYRGMGRTARLALAVGAGLNAMRWKGSAWLLIGPPVLKVLNTPAGRPLRRPFEWALRRLGTTSARLPPL